MTQLVENDVITIIAFLKYRYDLKAELFTLSCAAISKEMYVSISTVERIRKSLYTANKPEFRIRAAKLEQIRAKMRKADWYRSVLTGLTTKKIAQRFNVHQRHIDNIIRCDAWAKIERPKELIPCDG